MTRCPNCKENKLRSWEGMLELEGVEVLTRGMRCGACGEALFDQTEVANQEQARAAALVMRGIRTGAEFKFVRKMAGLKATEIAELFDVRPETVSRWERGEVEIPRLASFSLGELYERPRVIRARFDALSSATVQPTR